MTFSFAIRFENKYRRLTWKIQKPIELENQIFETIFYISLSYLDEPKTDCDDHRFDDSLNTFNRKVFLILFDRWQKWKSRKFLKQIMF